MAVACSFPSHGRFHQPPLHHPALHQARSSRHERTEMVLLRLANGADPTRPLVFPGPFHGRLEYQPGVARWLLSPLASLRWMGTVGGLCILRVRAHGQTRPEMVRMLLEADADPTLTDKHGVNPH